MVARRSLRTSLALVLAVAAMVVVPACRVLPPGTTAPAGPCATTTDAPAAYDHVVWIWMENHRSAQVIGSKDAPYLTELASRCGTASDYRSVGAPSLPNYIGSTSGSTSGIVDDADPAAHPITTDNLFRQVRATGRTVRTYAEAMPAPCARRGSGRYAVKHNPATYYVGGDDRTACTTENLPLGTTTDGALAHDLDGGALPAFTLVIPDLCNDTHDCPVATGDAWLHEWIPKLTGSATYREGSTAIFVVWDEPTPMPFVAVAPSVAAGSTTSTAVDHYALLRTTEELLGLPTTLGAASTAPSLRPLLHV